MLLPLRPLVSDQERDRAAAVPQNAFSLESCPTPITWRLSCGTKLLSMRSIGRRSRRSSRTKPPRARSSARLNARTLRCCGTSCCSRSRQRPSADIARLEAAFVALPKQISVVRGFEWGTNVSPENLANGFTHCFIVSFDDAAGRDVYLPHPAHKAFVAMAGQLIEKALVVDFFSTP